MISYRVLGALEVQTEGQAHRPTTPKVAAMLAALLCCPNQLVSNTSLIDELWETNPPASAASTIQTYIWQLRKFLRSVGSEAASGRDPIVTHPNGYLLHVDHNQLDATQFEQLVRNGQTDFQQNRYDEAATQLRQATNLWHGRAFMNIEAGRIVRSSIAHLEERLMQARELYIHTEFMRGRHREMISELTSLAQLHPLNEWVHARLIEALAWTGRRADALKVYKQLRTNLAEDLGIDPSPALQRLELGVLDAAVPLPGQIVPSADLI